MMHRMRRMTYTEIAKQLGIGDKGVQHHMTLALVRIRRALAAWSVAGWSHFGRGLSGGSLVFKLLAMPCFHRENEPECDSGSAFGFR